MLAATLLAAAAVYIVVVLLAAYRGREAEAASLIDSTIEGATAGGQGIGVQFAR